MVKGLFRSLLAMVLCLGLFLTACSPRSPAPTPFPTLPSTPTLAELPEFIIFVSPRPGDMVDQGVFLDDFELEWALLNLEEIAEPHETISRRQMQERVELTVDGKRLDVEVYLHGSNEAAVLGAVSLSQGEHEAALRVHTASGQLLEYSWRFIVVATGSTLPGLPKGLGFVRPLPDSIITSQQYEEEGLVPGCYLISSPHLERGICIGVLGHEITDPRDLLGPDDLQDMFYFVSLDNAPPGPDAAIAGGYIEPEAVEYVDEDGRVIGTEVGKYHHKCWYTDLAPGRHEVTVRLERTVGEGTDFTWWFVIAED